MKRMLCWVLSLVFIFGSLAASAENMGPFPTLGISDTSFILNLQNDLTSTFGYGVISTDGLKISENEISWEISPATHIIANVQDGEIQHIRVFGGKDLNNSIELILVGSCTISALYDGKITLDRACAVLLQALDKEAFVADDMRFRMGSSGVDTNYELLISPEALFHKDEQPEGEE